MYLRWDGITPNFHAKRSVMFYYWVVRKNVKSKSLRTYHSESLLLLHCQFLLQKKRLIISFFPPSSPLKTLQADCILPSQSQRLHFDWTVSAHFLALKTHHHRCVCLFLSFLLPLINKRQRHLCTITSAHTRCLHGKFTQRGRALVNESSARCGPALLAPAEMCQRESRAIKRASGAGAAEWRMLGQSNGHSFIVCHSHVEQVLTCGAAWGLSICHKYTLT